MENEKIMSSDELLEGEINNCLGILSDLDPIDNGEDYDAVSKRLAKLYEMQFERNRVMLEELFKQAEIDSKEEQRKVDAVLKERDSKRTFWGNVLRIGTEVLVSVGSVAAWIAFEGTWRKRSLIYEESGLYSSQTTKRIMAEKFPKIFGKK